MRKKMEIKSNYIKEFTYWTVIMGKICNNHHGSIIVFHKLAACFIICSIYKHMFYMLK